MKYPSSRLIFPLLALTSLAACPGLHAAARNWVGAGAGGDQRWSTTANWTGGVPTNDLTTDTATFNNGAGTALRSPNLDSNRSIAGISFAAAGTGYILQSTGGFTLTIGAGVGGNIGISSAASDPVISHRIAFTTAPTAISQTVAGTITFNSDVNFNGIGNANKTLTATTATSNIVMNGSITADNVGGAGTASRILKSGLGTWTINSANNSIVAGSNGLDRVVLSQGTIQLGATGALGATVPIVSNSTSVNAIAVLGTVGGITVQNQIQFLDGGAGGVHTVGGTNTSGTVTYDSGATSSLLSASDTTATAGSALSLTQFTAAGGGRVAFNSTLADQNTTAGRQGGINKVGAGTVTLNASNTYTLGTLVTAGTLLVNGGGTTASGVGSGPVNVNPGAVLGGSGRIAPAANNSVTINGSLSVGDSAVSSAQNLSIATAGTGALTLTSTATISLDIWTTSASDTLAVSGTSASLASGATLIVANTGGVTFGGGNTFNLFDWNAGVTGTFATISLPVLTNGYTWDVSDLYQGGTITVVPEASTMQMGAMVALLGAGALLRFRRQVRA